MLTPHRHSALLGVLLLTLLAARAPRPRRRGRRRRRSGAIATSGQARGSPVHRRRQGDQGERLRIGDLVTRERRRGPRRRATLTPTTCSAYATRRNGDAKAAQIPIYQKALALDPKHRGAHEYIGEAYLTLDDPAKARQHLAHAQLALLRSRAASTATSSARSRPTRRAAASPSRPPLPGSARRRGREGRAGEGAGEGPATTTLFGFDSCCEEFPIWVVAGVATHSGERVGGPSPAPSPARPSRPRPTLPEPPVASTCFSILRISRRDWVGA